MADELRTEVEQVIEREDVKGAHASGVLNT